MFAQFVAFLIGVWLTAAPDVLGYADPARASDHVVGPLAAMAALVAVFQATRPVRWVNLLLGVWLVLAPWALGYAGRPEVVQSMVAGAALAGLACVRGRIDKQIGGGWGVLWNSNRATAGRSA